MHVGITNPRWWEKRPRRSQRMRNPQLYVSGKGPIASRRVIGLTTHPLPIERLIGLRENPRTCIVMSRSGRQQSKYGDVDDLSRATCHVYGGKFDIKMQSKRYEKVCQFKEARYKIIQNDRFSWKKSCTNISLWWFWIYQNDIRLPCYFFYYIHFKVAWNSILALKSAFIYDVIISCLKAWYIQLTSKNWFFSKDNYFYLHNSHISVNYNW